MLRIDAQQVARVVEDAAAPDVLDDLLQDGHGKVRLADARLPSSSSPLRSGLRERVGDATRLLDAARSSDSL